MLPAVTITSSILFMSFLSLSTLSILKEFIAIYLHDFANFMLQW